MLRRPIFVNVTTESLKMTKKWSIFKGCFLAVNGLKWGIWDKKRHSGIFFTLLFAENRKFLSLFVLQIFAFKVRKSSILGRSTIIRYQCSTPLVFYFKWPSLGERKIAINSNLNNFWCFDQRPTMLYMFIIFGVLGVQRYQQWNKIFRTVASWGRRARVGETEFEGIKKNRQLWEKINPKALKLLKIWFYFRKFQHFLYLYFVETFFP